MPKIKLKVNRVAQRAGRPVEENCGDIIEVSDDEAYQMITCGHGEAVEEEEPEPKPKPTRKRSRPKKATKETAAE